MTCGPSTDHPLRLASLFQNGAVLQRGKMIPVWGWARPGTRVLLRLGGHTAHTVASEGGDFLARLPPVETGDPLILAVETPETGERLEINNLMAGEVWLASGQSNMEWTLAKSRPLTDEDIATANFPDIRFFNVAKRAHLGSHREVEGGWQHSTPETAANFSAVAFSFARRLHQALGVPVGIISSSWGGSIIETWLSRPALAFNPDISGWLDEYESEVWSEDKWNGRIHPGKDGRIQGMPLDPGNEGRARGWHDENFEDSAWPLMELPGTWQAAGHWHSGVFWFRRHLEIPGTWIGRDLELHLGAADKHDVAYVNGVEVGRTGQGIEEQHWNKPRTYVVPGAAVKSTHLLIAVRVHSFVYHGGLVGPADSMLIHPRDSSSSAPSLAGPWRYACEQNFGQVVRRLPTGHGEHNSPHMLYDNMIHPLAPYALRGIIWYQGESNIADFGRYAGLLRDLIIDWRRTWGDPGLDFHLVQLPGFHQASAYQPDSQWALLREAQAAALAESRTGMAVTFDLGEADDIHPKNKIPVGERLAGSILAGAYGRGDFPVSPVFQEVTAEGTGLRCHFHPGSEPLATTDGRLPRGFFVAGDDGVFHPAEAFLDGRDVIVRCRETLAPMAVCYAWSDNPCDCNLAGISGQLAGPFRAKVRP